MKVEDVLYGVDAEVTELLEVLGVDPSRCRRVVVDIAADSYAKAYVELYVPRYALSELKRILVAKPPLVEIVEVPGE